MHYEHIVPGIFLERPNRFIALVSIDGQEQFCHVKNTGRCREASEGAGAGVRRDRNGGGPRSGIAGDGGDARGKGMRMKRILFGLMAAALAVGGFLTVAGMKVFIGMAKDLKAIRTKKIKVNRARCEQSQILHEGDEIACAGITLRVLHTPGHTQGSVCLCAEDAMFSGDTLFRETCGRTDLPGEHPPIAGACLGKIKYGPHLADAEPGHLIGKCGGGAGGHPLDRNHRQMADAGFTCATGKPRRIIAAARHYQ